MVSKTLIGSSVTLWVLPRPGIKEWQRSKIHRRGPHPLEPGVLLKEMAEPKRRASECQARERGSTRPCGRLSPLVQEPEWMSNQSLGLGDIRPLCTFACRDAVIQDVAHARSRLIPSMASEAAGAPTLRPEPWRHCSISKAVWRLSLSETARASLWARMVTACPWPCLFSKRATECCPAGLWRRHHAAASEKAHFRWACPIFLPDVPTRVPADSLAHLTRRR